MLSTTFEILLFFAQFQMKIFVLAFNNFQKYVIIMLYEFLPKRIHSNFNMLPLILYAYRFILILTQFWFEKYHQSHYLYAKN